MEAINLVSNPQRIVISTLKWTFSSLSKIPSWMSLSMESMKANQQIKTIQLGVSLPKLPKAQPQQFPMAVAQDHKMDYSQIESMPEILLHPLQLPSTAIVEVWRGSKKQIIEPLRRGFTQAEAIKSPWLLQFLQQNSLIQGRRDLQKRRQGSAQYRTQRIVERMRTWHLEW